MLSNPKSLWAKPTETPIRHLLQWYGTDYRRKSNPSHWGDSLASDYQLLQKLKPLFFPNHNQFHVPLIPVVIPDVRFENEAQWITSNSGVLFLIDNPEAKSKYLLTHPEHSSDDLKPLLKYITYTFSNTQTQHHLAHRLLHEAVDALGRFDFYITVAGLAGHAATVDVDDDVRELEQPRVGETRLLRAVDRDEDALTGVGRATVLQFAREWAITAEKTGGKCSIIIGAGINHWYHNNLIYRSGIVALMLTGCTTGVMTLLGLSYPKVFEKLGGVSTST